MPFCAIENAPLPAAAANDSFFKKVLDISPGSCYNHKAVRDDGDNVGV